MFEGLYHSPFASLIPAAALWYDTHGALVLSRRDGQLCVNGVAIDSAEGSRQGCAFGAFLFNIAIHRCLTLTQEAHPDVLLLAYCDDVYVFHPTSAAAAHAAMATFRDHCRDRCRLESVPAKSFAYSYGRDTDLSAIPSAIPGSPAHPSGRLDAVPVVGATVGRPDAVAAAVARTLSTKTANSAVLDILADTEKHKYALQCRLILLRHCSNAVPVYTLRVTPPAATVGAAADHDALVAARLFPQLHCPHATDAEQGRALAQACLPTVMGGLGLTSAVGQSGPCYAASATSALSAALRLAPLVAARFHGDEPPPPAHCAIIAALHGLAAMRASVAAAWQVWDSTPVVHEPYMGGALTPYHPTGLPHAHDHAFQPLPSLLALPPVLRRGLQGRLTRPVHHANWHTLADTAAQQGDDRYRSILVDASQPGAGDYLRAIPSSPATTINTDLLTIRLLRQLRLPIPAFAELDPGDRYGDAHAGDWGCTERHTHALNVCTTLAERAHGKAAVFREPTEYHDISPAYKPDIYTLDGSPDGSDEVADVKVGATIVQDTEKEPGGMRYAQAAFARIFPRFARAARGLAAPVGAVGQRRYDPRTGEGYMPAHTNIHYAGALNLGATVVILCFNVFGGRSPEADRWFRRQTRTCGNRLDDDEASLSPSARNLRTFLSQRLSVSIARATAAQIRRGVRAVRNAIPRRRRGKRAAPHEPPPRPVVAPAHPAPRPPPGPCDHAPDDPGRDAPASVPPAPAGPSARRSSPRLRVTHSATLQDARHPLPPDVRDVPVPSHAVSVSVCSDGVPGPVDACPATTLSAPSASRR